jgi:hypothetical protein
MSKTPEKDDYPDSSEEDFEKLFVTCKSWGCSRALSNMNITIKEEDCENYHGEVDYMIEKFVRDKKQQDYFTLYFHTLHKQQKFPPVICDKLSDAYTVFSKGENRELRFEIE